MDNGLIAFILALVAFTIYFRWHLKAECERWAHEERMAAYKAGKIVPPKGGSGTAPIQKKACPACNGTGGDHFSNDGGCMDCSGTGRAK